MFNLFNETLEYDIIMRFHLPHQPLRFDIPETWLRLAGVIGRNGKKHAPRGGTFSSTCDSDRRGMLVPMAQVSAPLRHGATIWFIEDRMVALLKAMVNGVPLPALQVNELGPQQYRVQDGFHRFYAAAALGYACLPVQVEPSFDFDTLWPAAVRRQDPDPPLQAWAA